MFVIEKDATTENITLELTDNTTVENPTYLFIFESNQTGETYAVILDDLATEEETDRFNKFTLIEGSDDPENGEVILGVTGTYNVYIYAQSSTTNLDPDLADELVSRDYARLIDDEVSIYVSHTQEVTYAVHEPNT